MASTMVIVKLLILACQSALVMGDFFYNGSMDSSDRSALEAVKAAVVRGGFPTIQCYGEDGYWTDQPFRCDNSGRVYSVNLYNIGLEGSISPEIGSLTRLKYLLLYGNRLNGNIPSSIGNLTSLLEISLSDNLLSGSIPSSIEKLKSLYHFDISKNFFYGPITRVNGHPLCDELSTNCFFHPSLPTGCLSNNQRSIGDCEVISPLSQLLPSPSTFPLSKQLLLRASFILQEISPTPQPSPMSPQPSPILEESSPKSPPPPPVQSHTNALYPSPPMAPKGGGGEDTNVPLIVGALVGAIAFLGIIGAIVYFACFKNRSSRSEGLLRSYNDIYT